MAKAGKKAIAALKEVLSGTTAEQPATDKAPAKKNLRTREMHIRRGTKGGYIARHDMEDKDDGSHGEAQEHPIPTLKSLQAHVQENMQGDGEGQQIEDEPQN